MKKSYVYLTALLLFFVGIMDCFAVDIKTSGWFSGYDVSVNPYSCNGVNKGVLDLKDQDNVLYYSADCSVDFPCDPSSGSCVNTNSYSYTSTDICYITCDNYTNYSKIGENQHQIWNKIKSYPTVPCDNEMITDSGTYDTTIQNLIKTNTCEASSTFYALKEYKHEIAGDTVSKVVSVNDLGKCAPKIEVTKECKGFSTGTFKIQVGDEQATISCGESKIFEVAADTPIKVQELNSSNYMVYMDSKLSSDGTISVSEGTTEEIIITNALGKATLTKTNAVNDSVMPGITFTLEKKVGNEWVPATKADGTHFEDQTTNNNGQLTFSEIPVGEYRLREVSDKNGNFIASNPVEFSIDKDSVGKENNYTNFLTTTNNPFRVKLVKVDENGNKLDGAVFTIEKKNTQGKFETVSSVTIEKEGNYINFEKNGIYRIKETQAPIGYDVLQVPFVVEIKDGVVTATAGDLQYLEQNVEDGITVLKIKDDKSKIKIYKKDSATDKLIAGAKLVITNSTTGTVVTKITTTNNSFSLELTPGKYYITEESAPKGYERLTKKYEFVVKNDGTLQAITNDPAFEISGMSINIYNVKPTNVPDTGVAVNVFFTLGGLALIGFGGYLVYKNVKERKNIK